MTRRTTLAAFALSALAFGTADASLDDEDRPTTYQIRSYTTAPGKLDVLLERFARVNLPLFETHDITLVGAWTPHESDEGGERLIYLVAFPSQVAAERAWKAFAEDPDWQRAFELERREHGQVVTEVETAYLAPTDYSPTLPLAAPTRAGDDPADRAAETPEGREGGPRLYELRRYTASPGKLDALNARFREHTMGLFAKHGMTNVLYTMPIAPEDGAGEVLLYLLSHPGYDEAIGSWESFRSDPDWIAVRERSQPDGVPLAARVERRMLVPTEFSPLK